MSLEAAIRINYALVYDLPEATAKWAKEISEGRKSKWNFVWLIPANIGIATLGLLALPLHIITSVVLGIIASIKASHLEGEEKESMEKLASWSFHLASFGFTTAGALITKIFNPCLNIEFQERSEDQAAVFQYALGPVGEEPFAFQLAPSLEVRRNDNEPNEPLPPFVRFEIRVEPSGPDGSPA